MNNKQNIFIKILYISYFIFVMLTILAFLGLLYKGTKNYPYVNSIKYDEDMIDFNKGWHDENGKTVELNYFTKNKIFQNSKKHTIYRKIPTNVSEGDSLCFRSLSCFVTISIDGKRVIATPYKEMLFSCKSPGSVWTFYKFKKEDIGKTLEMSVELCYNDNSCYIENMQVGNAATYITNFITKNILSIVATIITLFLGILFIFADVYINIAKPVKEHTLLNIGLFASHMAIWCLFSTHIVELFVPGISQSVQYASCVLLFLIPYQTLFFVKTTFNIKYDKLLNISGAIILLLYGIATILQMTDLYDYHETLKLTHASLVLGMIALIYTLAKTHINGGIFIFKINTQKKRQGFIIATIFIISFLIIGVIFDMILFYIGSQAQVGSFTRYSIVIVIFYLGLLAAHNLYDMIKQLNETELSMRLAYKDNLTNLYNRTAFTRDFKQLQETPKNQITVGIVTFDVNSLKYVNDNYGHSAGDELIISAADAIYNAFDSKYTSIYRIGGDEFVALINDKDARKLFKICELAFESALQSYNNDEHNKDRLCDLSIAYGCEFYDSSTIETFDTLEDVLKSSDSKMYENKAMQKAKKKNTKEN